LARVVATALLVAGLDLVATVTAAGVTLFAQSGPELGIGDVAARPGAAVEVPIRFGAKGHEISTLLFSIDYDSTALLLDPADADGDGVPDAVALKLPAGLVGSATLDPNDTDGELDVLITGMQAPLPKVPDGTVVVLTFRPQSGSGEEGDAAAVGFASTPPPSFGSTTGQSVAGSASAGTVRWSINPAQPGATPGSGAAGSPTPGAAAPSKARPTLAARGRGAPGASGPGVQAPGGGSSAVNAGASPPAADPAAPLAQGAAARMGQSASDATRSPGSAPGALGAAGSATTATAAGSSTTVTEPAAPAGATEAGLDPSGDAAGAATGPERKPSAMAALAGDAQAPSDSVSEAAAPVAQASEPIWGWLFVVFVPLALVGIWLAYRRRSSGELRGE